MPRGRWDTFAYRIAALLNAEAERGAPALLKDALREFADAARVRHASVIFLGPDRYPLRCVDSATAQGVSACNQLSFEPDDLDALPDEGLIEDRLSATGEPLWVRTVTLPPSPYTALLFLHGSDALDPEMTGTYSGLLVACLKRYCGELPVALPLAEAMTHAMTELAQSLDREQILDKALSQLASLIPHDASDVMLRDGPVVRVARYQGYEPFVPAEVARSLAIPLEAKVFQVMRRTHAPIIVGEPQRDPDWVRVEAMDWIRSYMSAPIVIDEDVIGFINLYSRRPGFFAHHPTRNLQAFARYLAVAIQNAKLYERARQRTEESAALNAKLRQREQHLRSLNQLTSALNRTGDADEILQLGLDQALEITRMAQGAIYLYEPGGRTLVRRMAHASQAESPDPLPTPGHEAVRQAMHERRIIVAPAGSGESNAESLIAAPLVLSGTVMGAMILSGVRSRPPATVTTELLRAIVDQLAFAAQRGQHASQVRDQLSTVHTLYEISTAFLSQMNVSGVTFLLTRTLTDQIPQAMGTALYQENEDGVWSRVRVYVRDGEPTVKARWQEGETWTGEDLILTLCKQRQRQILVSQDQRVALPILDTIEPADAEPGLVYVPIVLPDREVWGIVALMVRDGTLGQGFAATLLQAILQQGIAAITRAVLYEKSRTGESRLQAILESSRDGIVLVGEDQAIRYVNGRALKLLNIPTSSTNWEGRQLEALRRALRTEAPDLYYWLGETCEADLPSEGRQAEDAPPDFKTLHTRILTLQRWPVHADQGATLGSLYLLRDVTEQRQLEQMRDDFLHMVVHDIRNPLSNIQNALRFVTDPMMADMAEDLLDIAQTNADRILKLVNTILEIGKLEAQQIHLEQEPVTLGDVIATTAQELMLSQQPFDFETVIPEAMPKVWADPAILVRILDNLLSNAMKFAPDGGIVRLTAADHESQARITVYNNGPHFSPEVESHLFQKFSPGEYEAQGYGLGLAFCRLAVEAHGGEINAANEPEGGVSFTFTLPLYQGQDIVGNVFLSNFEDLDV